MDKAKDEAINKLFAGQEKMGNDITELKQVCREQDKKLDDHELRISRLEK